MQLPALVANAVHVVQIFANGIMFLVLLSKKKNPFTQASSHPFRFGFLKLFATKMAISALTTFCVHVINYCSSVVLS